MKLDIWEGFLTLERRGKKYEDQRQKSLHHDTIDKLNLIKPRWLWDLYAHQVIPFKFSVVDANTRGWQNEDPEPRVGGGGSGQRLKK